MQIIHHVAVIKNKKQYLLLAYIYETVKRTKELKLIDGWKTRCYLARVII